MNQMATCHICETEIERRSRGSRGWRWVHTEKSPWPWHEAEPRCPNCGESDPAEHRCAPEHLAEFT